MAKRRPRRHEDLRSSLDAQLEDAQRRNDTAKLEELSSLVKQVRTAIRDEGKLSAESALAKPRTKAQIAADFTAEFKSKLRDYVAYITPALDALRQTLNYCVEAGWIFGWKMTQVWLLEHFQWLVFNGSLWAIAWFITSWKMSKEFQWTAAGLLLVVVGCILAYDYLF